MEEASGAGAEVAARDPDAPPVAAEVARLDRARAERAFVALSEARLRLAAAEARAEESEAALAAQRASLSWRVTAPLRRVANAVPRGLYHRLRFRSAPEPVLAPAPETAPCEDPAVAYAALDRAVASGRPVALLVDEALPEPDRDGGSVEIFRLAADLAGRGFATLFATTIEAGPPAGAAAALADAGVAVLPGTASAAVSRAGDRFALVVLNRVYCGGTLFEQVRADAPRARIVFNTIDLHWIRLAREAALGGDDGGLRRIADEVRARERALALACDASVTVSDREREILRAEAPGAHVVTLPIVSADARRDTPFGARDGIGFIGSFRHAPNVDALRWLVGEIWPLVLARRPDCRLSVVGADLPDGLLDGAGGRVEYLGRLPETGEWFGSLAATVAPLRFGAGIKVKIVSSLAAGVPVVATGVAVEGMALRDGQGVRIADDAAGLARAIVALLGDGDGWPALAATAAEVAASRHSIETWRACADALLASIGLPVP